ncbi:MAG: hypothetical protein HY397_02900 [Candidatus Doudnabacteria bacterium]|nr:hypothetical protein [Candidatus Doudnabacteria bacterium]
MHARYQAERLITLSEARKASGYTSDHLAYLCRNGFLWAERQGRMWLTCELAVANYKRVLEYAKKPVKLDEQERILGQLSVSSQSRAVPAMDSFGKLARQELEETGKAPRSRLVAILDTPAPVLTKAILRMTADFFQKVSENLQKQPFSIPSKRVAFSLAFSWLPVLEAPVNLPIGTLPFYLQAKRPIWQHPLVLAPAFSAIAGILLMLLMPNFLQTTPAFYNQYVNGTSNLSSGSVAIDAFLSRARQRELGFQKGNLPGNLITSDIPTQLGPGSPPIDSDQAKLLYLSIALFQAAHLPVIKDLSISFEKELVAGRPGSEQISGLMIQNTAQADTGIGVMALISFSGDTMFVEGQNSTLFRILTQVFLDREPSRPVAF